LLKVKEGKKKGGNILPSDIKDVEWEKRVTPKTKMF